MEALFFVCSLEVQGEEKHKQKAMGGTRFHRAREKCRLAFRFTRQSLPVSFTFLYEQLSLQRKNKVSLFSSFPTEAFKPQKREKKLQSESGKKTRKKLRVRHSNSEANI
jgi:hypothetical protein